MLLAQQVACPPNFIILTQPCSALNRFYQKSYIWYPILTSNFRDEYLSIISGSLAPCSTSCLALMVAAIGSLPDVTNSRNEVASSSHNSRADAPYAEAALGMLPTVLIECSVTAVQCLVIIALYYCCLLCPLQAGDYVFMASMKIQSLLKRYRYLPFRPTQSTPCLDEYY